MQIPCCALTAKKPGTGEHHPALIHPCARLHYATNLGTRARLHHYHLNGDEVNADSGTLNVKARAIAEYCADPAAKIY